jgi:predicted secreted protein
MAVVELTEADHGRRIAVDTGDEVVVRLPELGGAGYRWEVASLSGPARLVANRVDFAGAPGQAGTRLLELAFGDPGDVALRAVHRRPWEPDTSAQGEYVLHITVRD